MSCIIYVTDYELLLIKSSLLSLSSSLFIALCSFNSYNWQHLILFFRYHSSKSWKIFGEYSRRTSRFQVNRNLQILKMIKNLGVQLWLYVTRSCDLTNVWSPLTFWRNREYLSFFEKSHTSVFVDTRIIFVEIIR